LFLHTPGIQSAGNRTLVSPRHRHATLEGEIDTKLLDFAMQKSHTRKMANGKVDTKEVENTLANFLLTFISD